MLIQTHTALWKLEGISRRPPLPQVGAFGVNAGVRKFKRAAPAPPLRSVAMARLAKVAVVVCLLNACIGILAAQDGKWPRVVPLKEDVNVLEFVGQFINTGAAAQQFGYLSTIDGLDDIFNGPTQDETTALFTFVTNATTDRVINDGVMRIVNRTGTTTVYLNTPPSDFSNPASFGQGMPIQVSTFRQQVVINTLTNAFVTTHMNTVTKTSVFSLNGKSYRLGQVGHSFRTSYSGQSNTPGATPSGWFGGHAVGVAAVQCGR